MFSGHMLALFRLRHETRQSGAFEEGEEFRAGEARTAVAVFKGRVGEGAFSFVKFENPFFDGVTRDQSMDDDGSLLADAMGAVGGLGFDGRIPPRVEQENMVGGSEIQPGASGSKRKQHDRWTVLRLEVVDDGTPVARRPIESQPFDSAIAKAGFDAVQETRPLRKDQRFVPVGDGFFESFVEGFEFR